MKKDRLSLLLNFVFTWLVCIFIQVAVEGVFFLLLFILIIDIIGSYFRYW